MKTLSNYDNLIGQLDNFIRKYYKNKLLKGTLIAVSMIITAYTIVSFTEYYARLSVDFRTAVFFTFISGLAGILFVYIFSPLLKLFKIGKTISYKDASSIISDHFPEIQDKLLNTLELYRDNKQSPNLLIEAGINQKIESIKIFYFPKAINYKENYKYLKLYLL